MLKLDQRKRMIFILLNLRRDLRLRIRCGNFVSKKIFMSDFDPLASSEQDPRGFGNTMTDVGMDSDEDGSSNERVPDLPEETLASPPPPKTSACCDFDKVLASLDCSVFLPNSCINVGLPNAAITIHEVRIYV